MTSIEAGKRDVSITAAHAIARALGVSVDALLGSGEREEPEVVRLVHGLPSKAQESLARFLRSLPRRR
jgi:hypothetical protein